jgi:hypothetical protein
LLDQDQKSHTFDGTFIQAFGTEIFVSILVGIVHDCDIADVRHKRIVLVQYVLIDQICIVCFRLDNYIDKEAEIGEPMRKMGFIGSVFEEAIDFGHHLE